jgi:hypothetical protein
MTGKYCKDKIQDTALKYCRRFRKFKRHELLGSRTLESTDIEPSWRNVLRLEDVPWLADHKIVEDIVFPCAGYVGDVYLLIDLT